MAIQPAGVPLDKTLLSSTLVGREVELNRLEVVLQTVGQGKGQSVLISGEALAKAV